jgi:hypothetical protein
MPEGIPDEFETVIKVLDILIILLKFAVMLCTASWFATMPGGIEIIIAIEKPKAIITNNARIFLLDKFLTALVKVPIWLTATKTPCLIQKRGIASNQFWHRSTQTGIKVLKLLNCCHLLALVPISL